MNEIQLSKSTSSALELRGIDTMVWSAIKSSVFPGASDESIVMAIDYCKARHLDIMKKPCHIVPMNVKDSKTSRYAWRDVIMPGIAEQRITACRTGEYAGQDQPEFGQMVDVQFGNSKHTVPEWCCVTVYRIISGHRVGFSHTEFFEEACATDKEGRLNSMWTRRKRGQLSKCAEAGALRKAFPEELGGQATAEEMIADANPVAVTNSSDTKTAVRANPIDPFVGGKSESEVVDVEPEVNEPLTSVIVSDVEVLHSKPGAAKKWTAYRATLLADGNEMVAGTYSKTDGELLVSLKGCEAAVSLKEGEKGMQIESVESAPAMGGLL